MTREQTEPRISRHASGETIELNLSGHFDAPQLHEVYRTVCEIAAANQDVVISCEEVEFFSTGVLQSLIALANTLGAQGRKVRFVGVQPNLEKWLFLAGLA